MLKKVSRLFAARDSARFPDDENGDILYGIWKDGGDLDTPRQVDFSLVFPTREQANTFAQQLSGRKGEVEVSYFEAKSCWDLRFSPTLIPSWQKISEMEAWLGETAEKLEGRNDGWGFFAS